jgi:2-succinyl-6-hydroxy-2,4-cyclohexadiene-1-carboxylate synthase
MSERRLHAEISGSGTRLVLVHGFSQTGRSWGRLVPHFAETHQVMCVDLPGHGDSATISEDLAGSAELLGAAGARATYIGYSMGGRVALHLALARPDLVERLVLLGATGGLDSEQERADRRDADEQLANDLERDGVDAFLTRWLANPLFEHLPHDQAALDDRRRNSVAGLAASLRRTGTGTQQPLWARLHALEMPVLVLAGEYDIKFRAIGERIASTMGRNCEFGVVPAAGHAAHLERPDAFEKIVTEFLDTHRRDSEV